MQRDRVPSCGIGNGEGLLGKSCVGSGMVKGWLMFVQERRQWDEEYSWVNNVAYVHRKTSCGDTMHQQTKPVLQSVLHKFIGSQYSSLTAGVTFTRESNMKTE